MSSITVVATEPETNLTRMPLSVQRQDVDTWVVVPSDAQIPTHFDGFLEFTIDDAAANVTFNQPAIVFTGITPSPLQMISSDGKKCSVEWRNRNTEVGTTMSFTYNVFLKLDIDPTVTNDGPP
jgi:hypothetical protein